MNVDAAWTPDAPDAGLADDPAALIASGEQAPYDPAQDDHFEPVDTCQAQVSVTYVDTAGDDCWMLLTCGEDPGHYPETPHQATVAWTEPDEENHNAATD